MRKAITVGIDASRNRSGGARAHIVGILNEVVKNAPLEINRIHVWAYPELLSKLPNDDLIIKHSPPSLTKSIIHQIIWQHFCFAKEANNNSVDIMLNTDAGSVSRFKPAVTMSRDMLSYENGEMNRYGLSMQRLRLISLKYIQNYSLRKSKAAIFLTQYAANVIQSYSGSIEKFRVINHGVSENFRIQTNNGNWSQEDKRSIKCVYVSNLDLYKHQWNVAVAIADLRNEGYNIVIDFIGGGTGKAKRKFDKVIKKIKDRAEFIYQHEFVSHDELPGYLIDKDIFVFASSCENMPNTLIEGMCTGLPIACSNRGPMPEVLRDGGVYFDPEDVVSIREAIKTLIDNADKRCEFSMRSKQLSTQYSWQKCSKETFDFLSEIAI